MSVQFKGDGHAGGISAKPDICQPVPAVNGNQLKLVAASRGRPTHMDARQQGPSLESQSQECLQKQTVQLKTVSAPFFMNQLIENVLWVQADSPPQENIKIFKRDGVEMCVMQSCQCVRRYINRSAEIDSVQVRF